MLGSELDLHRLMQSPEMQGPRGKPFRAGPDALRLYCGLADMVQIAFLVGLASLWLKVDLLAGSAPLQAAGTGLACALATFVFRRATRHPRSTIQPPMAHARRAAASVLAAGAFLALYALVLDTAESDVALWFLTGVVGAALTSAGFRLLSGHYLGSRMFCYFRVLAVGTEVGNASLREALSGHRWHGWHIAETLRDDDPEALDRLRELVRRQAIDIVVLTSLRPRDGDAISIGNLSDVPVRICLCLDIGGHGAAGPSSLRFIDISQSPHAGIDGLLKRSFDVVGSGLLLLLLAPTLLLAAAAIKLETRGPVIFRQWRFGAANRPIQVLKFRTMHADLGSASGEARTLARDPRVTAVGRILRRTSIDELPQLVNVLKGDMSLVGPRPHAMYMKVCDRLYFDAVPHYRARHAVRPGITGWAQISGSRGEVDTLEKAQRRYELDMWYVRNWRFGLDLKILFRTVAGGFMTFRAD